MNDEEKRTVLLRKINQRQSYDSKWGGWDFIIAQCIIWIAILASFGASIFIAADLLLGNKLITALVAALPGTVIVIDRTFSFARRARWHRELYLRLDELANDLEFRDVAVEEVAERLSTLRIKMEESFPGMSAEGLGRP